MSFFLESPLELLLLQDVKYCDAESIHSISSAKNMKFSIEDFFSKFG